MQHKGLNQLICAALINGPFRETLLHTPAQALAAGYYEHAFHLTPQERDLVLDIRAQHLEDFAAQVHHWIMGNGHGDNTAGHRVSKPSEARRNGFGRKQGALDARGPIAEHYRAAVPAHAGALV